MGSNRRFENDKKGSFFCMRYIQCFLMFCGTSVAFAMRVNLSVAIVAITDKNSTNPDFPEYKWNEQTKSVVLSSFLWGYIFTQIPAGHLAVKFGVKTIALFSVIISSIISLILPLCVELGGWKLVCTMRVFQGLSQGVIFSSIHTLLSKWAPPEERGILGIYAYSGCPFGTVVMLAASGQLVASSLGWPSTFYIPGVLGLIWSIFWFFWGASTPNDCKHISEEEKKFIENSLTEHTVGAENRHNLKFPLREVLTSVPFYALATNHCAYNWAYWTLFTQMPNYMKNVLGMDIKSNALLSSLPYLASLIVGFSLSGVSTLLNKRQCMKLNTSRKLFNSIAFWIPALTLVLLGYVEASQPALAVALLTATIGINASICLGFFVNHIDLSPNFAGILMGMTNSTANIMSILAPLVVGLIVTKEDDIMQWRTVFFIASGFYFFGNLSFLTCGSTDVQSWNNPQSRHKIVPSSDEETQPIELELR